MRSVDEKKCYNNGFEFHRGNGANLQSHHRTALGKPTPSKWDDAQKWLVGFARGGGEKDEAKTNPRNSNADDRRLIAPVPQKEQDSSAEEEEGEGEQGRNVECDNESIWRINKPPQTTATAATPVRSICVRDMGTEMTPIASQEPSRTATPIRATTPAARSPVNSGSNTPVRYGLQSNNEGYPVEGRGQTVVSSNGCSNGGGGDGGGHESVDQSRKMNPLETRAVAWDEAERAKYMARYKREEVKIQAWENHEKRKAEMQMKKMEVKADRMKARAQEKLTNKVAATRRIAEEKRANAEATLNEKAVRTSERADYIRRTGHLPSSLSFKLPSFCW